MPSKPDTVAGTTGAPAETARAAEPDSALKGGADASAGATATDGGAAKEAAAPEPGAAKPTAKPETQSQKSEVAAPSEPTLFGRLDSDQRIRISSEQGERTLWGSALLVTLLYASLIAGHVLLGGPLSEAAQERERLRRGQDAPNSISVELVPDPDRNAKTTKWQEGANAAGPQPDASATQTPQMAALEETQQQQEMQNETERSEEPRAADERMLLDIESLVEAAAADLQRKIDRTFAKKPQKPRREQQAAVSGGGIKVRGTGASGRSDAFTRSVIDALMKTRPGPFALWGRVLVSFEVSETGKLKYVHLVHSSGNSALDKAALDAIRKARFDRPPPGLTSEERTYIIDYIFG